MEATLNGLEAATVRMGELSHEMNQVTDAIQAIQKRYGKQNVKTRSITMEDGPRPQALDDAAVFLYGEAVPIQESEALRLLSEKHNRAQRDYIPLDRISCRVQFVAPKSKPILAAMCSVVLAGDVPTFQRLLSECRQTGVVATALDVQSTLQTVGRLYN